LLAAGRVETRCTAASDQASQGIGRRREPLAAGDDYRQGIYGGEPMLLTLMVLPVVFAIEVYWLAEC
jgi:hypothetical protein